MKSVRLPAHVKPERYQLLIKPDLTGFTFEGEETIHLRLQKATRDITLHAKELEISEAEYKVESVKYKGKIHYNVKSETATFTFAKVLPKGKGELRLKFKGILNDKMRGFYRSRYMHEGKEKHLATTQFEATDARRAFPCFDEPAQKAIFDVTLMVPKGLTAISNTIESQIIEHEPGYNVVKFQPTPKMSTYLLAFIVGDFEFIEGRTKDNVLVRVFVTPGKKHQAKFALEVGIKCLEFYNKYFGIPYPLPVMDLIAIPDFTSGAMENWGAVTYRESVLLFDEEHSSASNKQQTAYVIAHELAHQWFGNLVTMDWWTDLWLNEGFATYMGWLAVSKIFPNWDIWTQFMAHEHNRALELDALLNTHPIEIQVRHPDEIGEIFDEISYAKGASIIRMLAGFLGDEVFKKGIQRYLKKHGYGNAVTNDLWKSLEKSSRKPVSKIMQSWTKKAGYPLIKITEQAKTFQLTQSRFFSSPLSRKKLNYKTLWSVPAVFDRQKLLMNKKNVQIVKAKSNWIKLNSGETAFFRVDYPAQMLHKLQTPIKNKTLPALDRLALIRDAFALAESGDLPTTQALELAKSYINETDYTVWTEIAGGLDGVGLLLENEKYFPEYEKYAQSIFKQIVSHVGFKNKPNESHTLGLLRSLALHGAGKYGNLEVKNWADRQFKAFKKSGKKISPDLRAVVYNLAAQNGGEAEHKFLMDLYKKETLHEERNRLGRALGNFSDSKLLKRTLDFSFSDSVRSQDMPSILVRVWMNPKGRHLAWGFVKKNIKAIKDRYALGGHMLSRIVAAGSCFITERDAKDIENFFKKHPAPGAQRTIQQVLEKIYSNAAWVSRDGKNIQNWLSK